MAVWGVGLYSNIKHFKNLFVRNHWTNFNITWQKCSSGDPLSRFSCHDALKIKKHGCCGGLVGGGGYRAIKFRAVNLAETSTLI